MHVPRANPPAKPRQTEAREAAEGNISNVPPHGALGGFALPTTTLVASTPTSSSGVGRLGDGGRGATKRWGEAVCVKERVPFVIGVGRGLRGTRGSEAGAEGAEGPETSAEGCDPTEAAWRARETRERRNWGGGTGGQLLVAKPVTSPDSATEPRRPEATLELRRGARGARLGSGAGERERVRVRGEAALRDAERNKEAATS